MNDPYVYYVTNVLINKFKIIDNNYGEIIF